MSKILIKRQYPDESISIEYTSMYLICIRNKQGTITDLYERKTVELAVKVYKDFCTTKEKVLTAQFSTDTLTLQS